MKVAVMNNSGNVGKSFLARAIYERFNCENPMYVEIETHNAGSEGILDGVIRIPGRNIDELFALILESECMVVDVGASNVSDFVKALAKVGAEMVLEEIDLFVVPVKDAEKQLQDTIKTIKALEALGVDGGRIVVVGNLVEDPETYREAVAAIKKAAKGIRVTSPIPVFDSVRRIEALGISVSDLAKSEKNYKKLAKKAFREGKREDGRNLSELALLQGSAKTVVDVLDTVFAEIIGKERG